MHGSTYGRDMFVRMTSLTSDVIGLTSLINQLSYSVVGGLDGHLYLFRSTVIKTR